MTRLPDGGMHQRAARPEDHLAVTSVMDAWWGRPIVDKLPHLFLDHFHDTSVIVEDDAGLAAFRISFLSPSQPDVAYIHFVGVRPDLRGRDLARDLYEQLFDLARSAGRREVHAVTDPSNAASIAFHTAMGFEVSGPIADYDGPGRPSMRFVARL